tara:strand:+ start:640 stop:924 length:285 start_codon:yes stop_codon:yes gene_type:complete
MSTSSDVFAIRKNDTGDLSFTGPARLRQVEVFTSGTGTPRLTLTDGNGGATLLDLDFTNSDTHSVNIPADGILFRGGVYVETFTALEAMTVFLS